MALFRNGWWLLILWGLVGKINIQTSTGEGWSLTNMESALFRSLQVVPNFLACGYHLRHLKESRSQMSRVLENLLFLGVLFFNGLPDSSSLL